MTYQRLLTETTEFYRKIKDGDVRLFKASRWNDEFVLTNGECQDMAKSIYMKLVHNYNRNTAKVTTSNVATAAEVPGC